MRAWLLTDKPDHPVLAEVARLLTEEHGVDVEYPAAGSGGAARAERPDLVLLKGHDPGALSLAESQHRCGVAVVNGPQATANCLDRRMMARLARGAGLPFPVTSPPAMLAYVAPRLRPADYPVVVKSRRSRRHDLVARVDSRRELEALAARWPAEPVVIQRLIASDGWDHKVWVVGRQIFYGRRRSPLDGAADRTTVELDAGKMPPGWPPVIRAVSAAFALDVYGVDFLDTADGPRVVDINPFPGCRGVDGAAAAIAALAARRIHRMRRAG